MARNKYSAPGKSHERPLSRKERKKLRDEMLAEQEAQQQPVVTEEDLAPTDEDKEQLRKIAIFGGIFVIGLLFFMYYMFAFG